MKVAEWPSYFARVEVDKNNDLYLDAIFQIASVIILLIEQETNKIFNKQQIDVPIFIHPRLATIES